MKKDKHVSLNIDLVVADILAGMSLKEKSLIANMKEESLPYLQYAFDIYISREIGNDKATGRTIMKQVWQTLKKTHRIRLISKP